MLFVSIFTNTRAFDEALWTGNCTFDKCKPVVSVSAKNNNDFGHKERQIVYIVAVQKEANSINVPEFFGCSLQMTVGYKFARQLFQTDFSCKLNREKI